MKETFPFTRAELQARFGPALFAASYTLQDGLALWLTGEASEQRLWLLAASDHLDLERFEGVRQAFQDDYVLKECPTSQSNARTLRAVLPWLQPELLGLSTSAGFGDRLGLATPGHVRALQHALATAPIGRTIRPIFAQQSIREMTRTHRQPAEVLADATWGTFQAGWRDGVGADADHLKSTADIDACVAAGYSFYTLDPSSGVDGSAADLAAGDLQARVANLPWFQLESTPSDLARLYHDQRIDLGASAITLAALDVQRAAAKYGRAIAQVVTLFRYLESKGQSFELEVSVDETETPTTHSEHIYIASELRRLNVRWVSLAPRYVGQFEKGIDYIGDLQRLRDDLVGHVAIATALGPYKLSLHSGSDKFSIYPLFSALTGGCMHLKTAGTSYVEALRVIAVVKPALFREIADLAYERYPTDRASYHVSASLQRLPNLAKLPDQELAGLLDNLDLRQMLHVTFGSVLDHFRPRIIASLEENSQAYAERLDEHFVRHLAPLLAPLTH